MTAARVGCVIVAAGSGSRLGAGIPKAFVTLGAEPMLAIGLRTLASLEFARVVVVAPESHLAEARAIADSALPGAAVIAGGSHRAESVRLGLDAIAAGDGVDIVLVHDAARPFTPADVFKRVVDAVHERGEGVVPVLPVVDTVTIVDADGRTSAAPARDVLRAVQTPQGFPFAELRAANDALGVSDEPTDDASIFRAAGRPVSTVPGDARSLKITTPSDLSALLGSAERVGTGVDAHAFSADPAAELWLAGLHWPGEPGLEGHSDGDVACHALVDALLGAAGLGDIGGLFGTDDPSFAGARGSVFVSEALRRVREAGWQVRNASIEIVGNRPKLAPRRDEAQATLAALLDAPVNLAATTTDGLGLTGEGRGVGAVATVLLARRLES